jgi:hypothetical protein
MEKRFAKAYIEHDCQCWKLVLEVSGIRYADQNNAMVTHPQTSMFKTNKGLFVSCYVHIAGQLRLCSLLSTLLSPGSRQTE